MDFEKIKLIIWDLDDTLWSGTLSEQEVTLPLEHRDLIIRLTDIGVVNSICSKNDAKKTDSELEKYGIREYFVFPSVNWEPKGSRTKRLIEEMALREVNVLFIDDNPLNLEEVRYFCPGIMTASPDIIPELIAWSNAKDRSDPEHKRLARYRVLEEKTERKKSFDSNEEFLKSSNIRVEIHTDCETQADRIYELIARTNQLNFTKKRISREAVDELLGDQNCHCGYVTVRDNFGDYGIVGFYAVRYGSCEHFLFSCRTLGMGVEQYVYNYLGRPELNTEGEVAGDLSSRDYPVWINQNAESKAAKGFENNNSGEHSVLIKGPCDLYQIFPFIGKSDSIDTEFTYVLPDGSTVESTSHTTHVAEAMRLSEERKRRVVSELPFMDAGAYCRNIYDLPYRVAFISLLQDSNLGVYRRKETGEKLAFIEYTSDLTNPDNYDKLINKKCNVGGFDFTEEFLRGFKEKYEFLGRNSAEDTLENLRYIRAHMNRDCVLVLMLGTETPYDMGVNPAYVDRHLVHKELNDLVKGWADGERNVEYIDVNRFITGPECFYDHINHFTKPVYYKLAEEMVELINRYSDVKAKNTSKLKIGYMKLHDFAGNTLSKLRRK